MIAPSGLTARTAVRVPASSANLGPSYDCGGLALALYDDLSAEVLPGHQLVVEVEGEGADTVPRDATHLVISSLLRGLSEAGERRPGLRVHCHNRIPHGRGLGSSSAAIVGGLALARGLLVDGGSRLTDARILEIATEIEGHPDNVAPALLGGFTIAWKDSQNLGRAVRLDPHPDIEPVVAIPATPLLTSQARRMLPARVPHAQAAANAARAALLTEAMTHRPDLLLTATQDWLHQDYRLYAYPQSHALMTELRNHGIPSMISGAGPTVIALGTRGTTWSGEQVVARVDMIRASFGPAAVAEFAAHSVEVDALGATNL